MSDVTGSPVGEIITQESTFVEGAPNIWIQDNHANLLNNPDSDGFYYGLSGTTQYPLTALGCVSNVSLVDKLTMNDVVCDNQGTVDDMMRRDYVDLQLEVSTLFPLSSIRDILRAGPVTVGTGVEKMGIGEIDQSRAFHAYLVRVYDRTQPAWITLTLHRAKFVDAWTIGFRGGSNWQITGIKLRVFADSSKPAAQRFLTMIRYDPNALP